MNSTTTRIEVTPSGYSWSVHHQPEGEPRQPVGGVCRTYSEAKMKVQEHFLALCGFDLGTVLQREDITYCNNEEKPESC